MKAGMNSAVRGGADSDGAGCEGGACRAGEDRRAVCTREIREQYFFCRRLLPIVDTREAGWVPTLGKAADVLTKDDTDLRG